MNATRSVKAITVTYTDGETETFEPIEGFHRKIKNNKPRDMNPDNMWIDHEIHWSER